MALNGQGFTQGMTATGAGNAAYGEGLRGELGARSTAYGGDMSSAGTIGQGDIAAANAKAAGSQNIINAGDEARWHGAWRFTLAARSVRVAR
jgi:hypothetical protein